MEIATPGTVYPLESWAGLLSRREGGRGAVADLHPERGAASGPKPFQVVSVTSRITPA